MDVADPALAALVAGTASETGERFFAVLVENLSKALVNAPSLAPVGMK